MFYFGEELHQAPKKCGKCKSKKLKFGITSDEQTQGGMTLIRRVPSWTCKKCKSVNVALHHLICEDALERWLDEDEPEMTIQ